MDSYWEWNKENFDWHYDPSSDHKDVTYVGRFAHPNLEQVVQETVANLTDKDYYNEVSIKGEPYNEEAREIMEGYHNDLTRAGFNEHNTGGRQTRQDCLLLFQRDGTRSGLWNPQIMFLEQPPGKFVPWHRDSYNNYRRTLAKVGDDTEVITLLGTT